jgi:hypothetical protein
MKESLAYDHYVTSVQLINLIQRMIEPTILVENVSNDNSYG